MVSEYKDNQPAPEAFDASDEKALKKAQAAAKLREQERKHVTAAILSTKQGREWLWQLLFDCRTFEKRMAMTGSEAENGFFEGQREVGLNLLRLLSRSDAEKFALMMQENDK